jgi:hypothetical protein
MAKKTALQKLKRLAEENDWKFYSGYSGRGMYGKRCAGIVTDQPHECIAIAGIRGAKLDNMGLQYIVYWPNIECDED